MSDLIEIKLNSNLEIAPDVHLLSFTKKYDFIPGQVIKITDSPEKPPRIYSICSGNQENEISILFNVKNEGYLTPRLSKLLPGDKILISRPYGSFTCTNEPALWIAMGTGIAPFYSMVRSGLSEKKILIHGVRYLNQFYFEEDLKLTMEDRYIRCCSYEKSDSIYAGRVTDYLNQLQNPYPVLKHYICGNALMVVETRDLLISKGIPFNNIFSEIYF